MKHLLPLCLLLIATCTFAQNKTINGKITDASNNAPMFGATVLVKGTHIGTATDSLGRFTLQVPAGSKTLTVSYVGYVITDVPITANGNIKVALQSADIPGKEVVVSSSRTAEAIQEAPMQVEKMTSREIQSAASGDFYQSIGNFKGVDIVTTSAFFKVINLRGFGDTRSLRTKQYIDGVDNEAPGLNFPIGNMVGSNDLDLENVEVVSGAASALYGANAMQGVISMTTKSPYDFQGISFQIKGGASTVPGPYFDAQMRYASTFGKKNRFAFKFTGEYTQLKDWPATNDSINHYGAITANVNVTSVLQQQYSEPYCPTCPVTTTQHNNAGALLGWLSFNTEATNLDPTQRSGYLGVTAPGYAETSLADNNAQNIKFSTAMYYRFTDDLELSAEYRFGYGTAVYQATTRYQIKDFFFHQPILKLKGKNFFVQAYTSLENAGQSYNLEVTGDYLSAAAAPAYVNSFTTAYFNTINTLVGGFANCPQCFTGTDPIGPYGLTPVQILDSARNVARRTAASAWLVPGTTAFMDTFNRIISDKNSLTGTQFYDRSALVNLDGQYNWDFVKWMDILTGASYRIYMPNSEGTILSDTNGVTIREQEVGVYLQATKKLFHDHFKIIGSLRVDKNSNFNAQVSPRLSLVYTYKGKNSTHTFRGSITSAFRDPTLQDQYLYLNLGQIILVGNEHGMDNLYTLNSVNNALALLNQTQNGSNVAAAEAALVPITLNPVRPEHLTSADFGYRVEIVNRVYIDLSAYYSIYNDFIGFTRVVSPNSNGLTAGVPATTNGVAGQESGADNIIGGYYQPLQTWVNSTGKVPSWGAACSVAYYVGHGITPYVNYTYTGINDKNLSNDSLTILSGFNTPTHKINIGIQANRVWKGLGFTLNWKWVTSYEWDSPFADGIVPSFNTLDAQINYEVDKIYSTFRLGGSNIYNNMHIEAVGAPEIGALYYVGWMFDFNKFNKKNHTN